MKSETFENEYLIYNRKSTDDAENQKNSLEYQRQRNVAYSKEYKLPIANLTVAGFCEDGIVDERHSGFKEEDEFKLSADGAVEYQILRPKFLRLVHMLKSKQIKGAIFLCWDRASRNPQDDMLIKRLMKLGCDIRFVNASYDKSSSGELHMDIDGMFAAHYSRVISEKIRAAHVKLRAEGKCIYQTPIGYLDEGNSDFKPFDPVRAPIVKRIFELYATGEWSFSQLAKWAQAQGLTKKEKRKRRTTDEMLSNLDPASLPKVARSVDHKTIELILKNQFYVGRIKVGDKEYQPSNAHQPLIDVVLFNQVQNMLKKRQQTIHYIDKTFYMYRGLLRCSCGRSYSPYVQKGITYYRSRCKEGCENPNPNIREDEVTISVQKIVNQIAFTDEELAEIESGAQSGLKAIDARRDNELQDFHAQQRRILSDLSYLAQNSVTLLRTGTITPEALKEDRERLEAELEAVETEISMRSQSAKQMLNFTLKFSELVKNASQYFQYALDVEKREITTEVFTELVFKDRELVKYDAKEGFGTLLARPQLICGE